jgi:hypothetical protein
MISMEKKRAAYLSRDVIVLTGSTVAGAGAHIRILGGAAALLRLPVGANPRVLVYNTCNKKEKWIPVII